MKRFTSAREFAKEALCGGSRISDALFLLYRMLFSQNRFPLLRNMLENQDLAMKTLLLQIFTWWHGQTIGTRFFTHRTGERVGEDQFGNLYYQTRDGAIDPALGHVRRWVIFKGEADASMVPPGWHGWLHHRAASPPSDTPYAAKDWEKPHQGNLTGSSAAYHPKGSTLNQQRPAKGQDGFKSQDGFKGQDGYQAWTP
jgi:NADH:ubiquinone oxidoreductase subunit